MAEVTVVVESTGLTLESALDFFRTEGGWEPTDSQPLSPAKVGAPGRFVNQCGRCLEFKQAARKDLSRSQRVWLCSDCAGPNPPEVIVPQARTFRDFVKETREAAKAADKEQRKRDREEAKARKLALPRVRRSRLAPGKPKNPESEGS